MLLGWMVLGLVADPVAERSVPIDLTSVDGRGVVLERGKDGPSGVLGILGAGPLAGRLGRGPFLWERCLGPSPACRPLGDLLKTWGRPGRGVRALRTRGQGSFPDGSGRTMGRPGRGVRDSRLVRAGAAGLAFDPAALDTDEPAAELEIGPVLSYRRDIEADLAGESGRRRVARPAPLVHVQGEREGNELGGRRQTRLDDRRAPSEERRELGHRRSDSPPRPVRAPRFRACASL